MKQSIWTANARPQSFVTKGKQRLKQHNDTVYLNNGDEFEIELHNPTQNKILAKLEMDGNSIGSGIILRPGERVFLERHLNEAKKFLFETYKVSGSNESKSAIQKNGGIVIKFYNVQQVMNLNSITTGGYWYNNNVNTTLTIGNGYSPLTSTSTGTNLGNATYTSSNTFNLNGAISGTSNTAFFNQSSSPLKTLGSITRSKSVTMDSLSNEVETGRVEKGSSSNQTFSTDSTSFESFPFATDTWKILPQSQKILVKEDLVVYCTECGSKRKKDTHKFCPQCGTKF
jgi:hypothetical protein